MSPLIRYNGKLLKRDGKLAGSINCCCGCKICQTIEYVGDVNVDFGCNNIPEKRWKVTIPPQFALPVNINITGEVNDDMFIDGNNDKDPGPYVVNFGGILNCNEAHTVGTQPGPFQDVNLGGITFPMNNREFVIGLMNYIATGGISITVCINPNSALCPEQVEFITEL